MSNTNTGGPAFPLVYDIPPENVRTVYQGMTLRDYFAAAAIQGLVITEANQRLKPDSWAQEAYMVADAMLKAREQ